MVPVRHRTQIEYNQDKLGVNAIAESVREQKYNYVSPCALYHINRKLLLEPKVSHDLPWPTKQKQANVCKFLYLFRSAST